MCADVVTVNDTLSRNPDSQSEDGSQSYPGSVTYPYNQSYMQQAVFARCFPIAKPNIGPETYTGPLSMLGHGIALWEPIGVFSYRRKKKHLRTGINIGDVGFLSRDGAFLYFFNIFCSADDDIQVDCPPSFEPLSLPDPNATLKDEMFFAPGTALVSKDVTAKHISSSPLDIEFTINARESGILILPEGASREDLVSTQLVRDYVHKNALAWCMHINKTSDPLCPNGHLYVITGCDKTDTYALATSSPSSLMYSNTPPTIRYHNGKWQGHERHHIEVIESDPSFHADKCAVFVRGMQVALKKSDWINYIFRNEPSPRGLSFYYVLSVPVSGLRAKWQTRRETQFRYTQKRADGSSEELTFNPSVVIANFLIQECPNARVAIAEDRQWCSLTNNENDATVQQFTQILRKVLEVNEVSEQNGLATLVPVKHQPEDLSISSTRQTLFDQLFTYLLVHRRRLSMAFKLAKIFPGRGLPDRLLE